MAIDVSGERSEPCRGQSKSRRRFVFCWRKRRTTGSRSGGRAASGLGSVKHDRVTAELLSQPGWAGGGRFDNQLAVRVGGSSVLRAGCAAGNWAGGAAAEK